MGASPTRSRAAYRADAAVQLAALNAKRKRLGITQNELAVRAGIARNTLQRAFADGKAFRRTVSALTLALRELEKEKARELRLFTGV